MTWVKARDDSGNFVWLNMALVRSLVRVVDALPDDPKAKTVVCFDEADTHSVHETPEYLIGATSALSLAREETRENWIAAMAMIREAIETLGPPGTLPAKDAVGPEPTDEATVIVAALQSLLRR